MQNSSACRYARIRRARRFDRSSKPQALRGVSQHQCSTLSGCLIGGGESARRVSRLESNQTRLPLAARAASYCTTSAVRTLCCEAAQERITANQRSQTNKPHPQESSARAERHSGRQFLAAPAFRPGSEARFTISSLHHQRRTKNRSSSLHGQRRPTRKICGSAISVDRTSGPSVPP